MTLRSRILDLLAQDEINFLLTNRIPRRLATRLMGWFSRIEQPLVRDLSIGTWRIFCDPDLSEAKKTRFCSMHECFIRELKEGARPIDDRREILVSPCDGVVGACGTVAGTEAYQIKGSSYQLQDLFCDSEWAQHHRDGCYVTLRLTAGMYHRFHAPHDCIVEKVTHIWGDTWNVNPAALRRVDRLFCRNERAVLRTRLAGTRHVISLVPVAAILVAGIRLHFMQFPLSCESGNVNNAACEAAYVKGEEIGWFEHGSTIVVFAPNGFKLSGNVREGNLIRFGEPLMHLPDADGCD
jgi:phosphatidylserine decarboxylase